MSTPRRRRVRKHQDMPYAAGLRPVQVWGPDTRRRGFAEKCRCQSLVVAAADALMPISMPSSTWHLRIWRAS